MSLMVCISLNCYCCCSFSVVAALWPASELGKIIVVDSSVVTMGSLREGEDKRSRLKTPFTFLFPFH